MRPRDQEGPPASDFRELMSRFPTGVAIVTTVDDRNDPVGMTCSSLTSVCVTPPTLLVCLHTAGTTLRAARARRAFSVNLLEADARRVAEVFSASGQDRFGAVGWRRSPMGMPWLDETVAVADCAVVRMDKVGDHTVVYGEVASLAVREGRPLLYGMRNFVQSSVDWFGTKVS
ncbi:flavin reductase family protein [Lentzea sp. PSKA42]|jgi:flavin reductase (NADH)|uniref:Flavin reductase family protein n=1 Tax=Lentzea indica TaxID=2604800 RepID=A0ABX1FIJ3_9PSEU|nr:flavin reductase family protein [Lentzea indica]NKE58806.1 flavin reductase family protein [Lentzea indica]